MSILVSGASDIGRKRKTNQDSIYAPNSGNYFVVADGMGGHNGGDIASQMTTKIFPQYISENIQAYSPDELLKKTIKFINRSIYDHGQSNEDLKGMGTTITSVFFTEETTYIANIGDSRTYLIHNNSLFQLTRDHSLVQEKLNLGIYDRKGAKADPQKNVLTKTVGFEKDVDADVYKFKNQNFDIYLLCSDGLHGKVCDEEILKIVQYCVPNPQEATQEQFDLAVENLIRQANLNGGQDNISVVLAMQTY